jgi:hypothetical protein
MSGSAVTSPFPAEALEANRAGRLTETQGKNWIGADRDWRGNVRLMALVLGLAGVLLVAEIGQTPFPTFARFPLGAVCLLVAAYLVYVSRGRHVDQRPYEGRVETVEGAISREGRGLPVYNPNRSDLPPWPRYDPANSKLMMFTPDATEIVEVDPWKSRLDLVERAFEAEATPSH